MIFVVSLLFITILISMVQSIFEGQQIADFIYITSMNSEQMINSIYNPKKKQRQAFVFPKISKAQPNQPQNKVFVRGASRKYNQQNIFKIQDQKRQRVKIHIEQQKLRQIRNRQCEQLQQKMAQMARRHNEQMRQIEQTQKQLAAQIQAAKKDQYQYKLGLWELKNEIMNLNSVYLEEQNQYKRLYNEVGYIDGEDEGEEAEYQQQQNQDYEQQGLLDAQNLEEQCLEGEEVQQLQPRDASRALTLQMQQLQISSQLQLQQQSHSVM